MSALSKETDREASLHIQSVSRLTNLSVDTIRAWEKRYAAVIPTRGPARQRLFSTDDVARLVLLKEAVDSGESISQIASWTTDQLRSFVESEHFAGDVDDAIITRLFNRVRALESHQLTQELSVASLSRSAIEFADDVIAPLMVEITANARNVEQSAVQELVLCECLHSISSLLFAKYARKPGTAQMIFLTLPGERHSTPPLMAALAAADAGYRSVFVGTEIAPRHVEVLVRATGAVALGVYIGVNGVDALRLLRDVKKRLPNVTVFVGSPRLRIDGDLHATQTLREFATVLGRFATGE
jgi:DNA-binding transcriptional MerR regulator